MKPPGTPVASVILAKVHTELSGDELAPYLKVSGWGVLAPDIVIPNEWWDRSSLVVGMEVTTPKALASGALAVEFQGRCAIEHIPALKDLVDSGVRELIEREVVPPILVQLGLKGWSCPPQAASPFCVPTDAGPGWYDDPPAWRSRTAVLHDLVRLSCGQSEGIDRDKVLQEARDHGMLTSPHFAVLVAKAGLAAPAVVENSGPVSRRSRVRIVDT